jgi:hypothetical protein
MSGKMKTSLLLAGILAAVLLAANFTSIDVRAQSLDDAHAGCSANHEIGGDASRLWFELGAGMGHGDAVPVAMAVTHATAHALIYDLTSALQRLPLARGERRVPRSLASRSWASRKVTLALAGVSQLKRIKPSRKPVVVVDPPGQASAGNAGLAYSSTHGGVLQAYVMLVRSTGPRYAQVTSGFDDYRPGRKHNGYDVGLDAGTPVPAGWGGVVTKIEPWYGDEHCITVRVGDVDVNYGHVIPTVKVGQVLRRGDILGTVAYDHVDIKMHDGQSYIDFNTVNPFPELVDQERHVEGSAHAPVLAPRRTSWTGVLLSAFNS